MTISLTSSDQIALGALLVSALSFWISFLNYNRDNINIKLELRKNQQIMGASHPYREDETYVMLIVYNKGRHDVFIEKVGYVFLNYDGGGIFADSMQGIKKVIPGNAQQFLVVQERMKFSEIAYFAAYDNAGNTYKLFQKNRFQVYLREILHKLKLWKKPSPPRD